MLVSLTSHSDSLAWRFSQPSTCDMSIMTLIIIKDIYDATDLSRNMTVLDMYNNSTNQQTTSAHTHTHTTASLHTHTLALTHNNRKKSMPEGQIRNFFERGEF